MLGRGEDELSPDLKLWNRMLCVLLAYIFLVSPEAFQQVAMADSQYSQVSTFIWADGNDTIEYAYNDNGSLMSKITYKRTRPERTEFEKGLRYDYNLKNAEPSVHAFSVREGGFS